MYNEYFGFRESPFSIAPDPRYLYLSEMHQDGLAHLNYGLTSEGCIILLTGEVGTGKTTLCRFFLEQLEPTANVALIINPGLSSSELLSAVCDEFRVAVSGDAYTTKHYLDALNEFLLQAHADNNPAMLVIDEAQNLDKEALEMIRLLTNLETNRQKLLKIFLLGQSELSTVLTSPDLSQVSQRITGRFHLTGLQPNETSEYIRHRLTVASGTPKQLFSDKAVKRIHQITGGIPRLINNLCDRSLIGAYAEEKEQVDEAIVRTASREIFGFDHASKTIEVPVKSLLIGATTMLAIMLIWVGSTSDFFHLNLSSVLPPPQQNPPVTADTAKPVLEENEVSEEEAPISADMAAAKTTEDQPIISEPVDDQAVVAGDEIESPTAEADSEEQYMAELTEAPVQNKILIAPVEISERREKEAETRIVISTIEIAD